MQNFHFLRTYLFFFSLGLKEIKNRFGMNALLTLGLSFGLTGILMLSSFQRSIELYLSNQVREIVSGDMVISSSKPFTNEQSAEIDRQLKTQTLSTEQIIFPTMVQGATDESPAKLVQIVAVGNKFPLLDYQRQLKASQTQETNSGQEIAGEALNRSNNVWMSADLAGALGLQIGDEVTIGEQRFVFDKQVDVDLASRLSFLAFLPKVYIGLDQVENTNLLGKMSRIRYQKMFLFNDLQNNEERIKEVATSLKSQFTGNDRLSIQALTNASDNLNRVNENLTSYLSLMSIIALGLSSLGTLFLYQNYISSKKSELAILLSLGAKRSHTYFLFLSQLAVLGVVATILSWLQTQATFWVVRQNLPDFLLSSFELIVYPSSFLTILILAVIGLPAFCFPAYQSIRKLSPAQIFQNANDLNHEPTTQGKTPIVLWLQTQLFVAPIFFFFAALTFWIAPAKTAALFIVAIVMLSLFYFSLTRFAIALLSKVKQSNIFWLDQGLLLFLRKRSLSINAILVITLGATILNLVLQVYSNLARELTPQNNGKQAQFILFDIQPEQVEPLKNFAKEQNIIAENFSPMLRAQLISVNGKPWRNDDFEQNPEQNTQEADEPPRRRGTFNLSYRDKFSVTEQVIAGDPQLKRHDPNAAGPIPISLEEGFATRNSLKIGDQLLFNLLGVDLVTQVTSLRKVLWTSFEPNFFILFPPGPLQDAPQTYIANLRQIPDEQIANIAKPLTREFPNISLLDVRQTIELVLNYTDKVLYLILLIAGLVSLAGIVALYAILKSEIAKMKKDYSLLKTIGVSASKLFALGLMRYTLIISIALGLCALTATAFLQFLSKNIFLFTWQMNWLLTAEIFAFLFIFGCMVSALEIYHIIRKPTRSIIESL